MEYYHVSHHYAFTIPLFCNIECTVLVHMKNTVLS